MLTTSPILVAALTATTTTATSTLSASSTSTAAEIPFEELAMADPGLAVVVRTRRGAPAVIERTLRRDEIARAPGSAGDTVKAVLNLPGAARSSFGGGDVILRGSSPGDSGTLIEGQPIPQLNHFGGLRSTFSTYFLDEVSFVPGNFGAEFGRFTGGIIDVRVRDPDADITKGMVDVNLYDASFALEGPVGEEVSLGGAFRRSYIDAILPAVLPDDAPISFDAAPRFYDYQLLASWRPSKSHRVRLLFFGSQDRLELLFADPAADPKIRGTLGTQIMAHSLQLSSKARLSSTVRQELSVQAGLQKIDLALGPELFFDLASEQLSVRASWTVEISPAVELRGGVDSRYVRASIDLRLPDAPKEGEDAPPLSAVESSDANASVGLAEPGAFVEARLRPTERLLIVPSLRVDWYEAIGRLTLDPRLLAELKLGADTRLRGGVGLYQKQPEYDESAEATGNPDLLAERSLHGSVGIVQTLFEAVDLEVTWFAKRLDRLVVRDPRSALDPGARPYSNDGTGRIFGLEVLAKASLGSDFSAWVAYTFQRSLRRDGPERPTRRFDFDQPHLLTLLATADLGGGFGFGTRFRLASGNPETPITGSIYDAVSDVYVPIYGGSNSSRLGTFWQLDVRLDKKWEFEDWRLAAVLDVQNVTNRKNPEGSSYSYDYSARQDLSGLPILPILGVRGEW